MYHWTAPQSIPRRRSGLRAPWVAAAGLTLIIGLVAAVWPPAASAATPCLEPPVTVAELIALEEEVGPLTLEFDPTYGVYAEHAVLCFGDIPIELDAFVASPEGLGGVVAFTIEPTWMTSLAWFVAVDDSVTDEGFAAGPFMPVAVPPELEAGFIEARGRWVRLRGHFGDQVARTCRVVSESPELGAVPTVAEAINICGTSFVVETLSVTAGPQTAPSPPATDTVSPPASARDDGIPTSIPWPLLAGALGAVVAGIRGRRPVRGSR